MPEGQKAGPKGRQLEVGTQRAPRLLVDNNVYVTGGCNYDERKNYLSEILRWDPFTDSWQNVGNLTKARSDQATVAISSSIIESECFRSDFSNKAEKF